MVGKVLIINEISTFMGAETGTIKTLKTLYISHLRPTGRLSGETGKAVRQAHLPAPNYLTTVSEGFSGRMRAAMM